MLIQLLYRVSGRHIIRSDQILTKSNSELTVWQKDPKNVEIIRPTAPKFSKSRKKRFVPKPPDENLRYNTKKYCNIFKLNIKIPINFAQTMRHYTDTSAYFCCAIRYKANLKGGHCHGHIQLQVYSRTISSPAHLLVYCLLKTIRNVPAHIEHYFTKAPP